MTETPLLDVKPNGEKVIVNYEEGYLPKDETGEKADWFPLSN